MIRIVRTIEGVVEISDIWKKLQCHPNADVDFFLTIVNARKEIVRPHIMVFEREGNVSSLMVGRLERRKIDFQIGYKTVYSSFARIISIIYGGFLGEESEEIVKSYIEKLIVSLDNDEADLVIFNNIKFNSKIWLAAKYSPGYIFRDVNTNSNKHWVMNLPINMDNFYEKFNRHRRHELKRYIKVLEKTFINNTYCICYKDLSDLNRICVDLEEIQKKTYHRGLNVGFYFQEEYINRLSLWLEKGLLRAYVLYIANKPCAYWMGTGYGKTFFLDFTGYDPEYNKYEIGTILFQYMVGDLIKQEYDNIDFGFGDAAYKRKYCDISWEESIVYMYSRTLFSFKIKLIREVTSIINRSGKKLMIKLKMADNMKKKWRQRKTKNMITNDAV